MAQTLLRLDVENYKALRNVSLPLKQLTVLAGPNGAGKSTVLETFNFLSEAAENVSEAILGGFGGSQVSPAQLFTRLQFRGSTGSSRMRLTISALLTANASIAAPDEYSIELRLSGRVKPALSRRETFVFKRTKGRGRRITLSGGNLNIADLSATGEVTDEKKVPKLLTPEAIGLSTLPVIRQEGVSEEVAKFRDLLSSFEVFDPQPHKMAAAGSSLDESPLTSDGSNLASALAQIANEHAAWTSLRRDIRVVCPWIADIEFTRLPGRDLVVPAFRHRAGYFVTLDELSYGTRRLLAILVRLTTSSSSRIIFIEEVDHGLHPHALELVVDRVREASESAQFILTTHSPTLVSRLEPEELVICELDPTSGAAVIPALDPKDIRARFDAAANVLELGELWFGGAIGGGLE